MPVPVTMPKFGLTMTEGTVAQWLVADGDQVEQDQPIAEIETEKIINELLAPAAGRIAAMGKLEGESAEVSAVVAWVLQDGESVSDIPADSTPVSPEAVSQPEASTPEPEASSQTPPRGKAPSSPSARRLAKELDIDLQTVTGTGPGGRITREDVQRAAEAQPSATLPPPGHPSDDRLEPWLPMQRIIIRSVTTAATIPSLTLFARADASRLKKLADSGRNATPEDGIILCAARTLRDYPLLNASFTDGGLQLHGRVNVGLTMSVEHGLMVPVIRDADQRPLAELAAERVRLAECVRSRKLSPHDISDATFTITNLGVYPVDRFAPLLNPPQAAILSVGRLQDRPAVEKGKVVIQPTIEFGLTVDHRVMDGAKAAACLDDLIARIESLTVET